MMSSEPSMASGEAWWSTIGRRPRAQRVEPTAQRRGADRPLVEGAVEAPPDPLQDLGEGHRRGEVVGHSPAQCRVQVVVGADVAGQDQGPRAVPADDARRRGADGRDPVALPARRRRTRPPAGRGLTTTVAPHSASEGAASARPASTVVRSFVRSPRPRSRAARTPLARVRWTRPPRRRYRSTPVKRTPTRSSGPTSPTATRSSRPASPAEPVGSTAYPAVVAESVCARQALLAHDHRPARRWRACRSTTARQS